MRQSWIPTFSPALARLTGSFENRLVIETLREAFATDPKRKAFRLVGGVLVERTVADVLPELEERFEQVRWRYCFFHPSGNGVADVRWSLPFKIKAITETLLKEYKKKVGSAHASFLNFHFANTSIRCSQESDFADWQRANNSASSPSTFDPPPNLTFYHRPFHSRRQTAAMS